MDKKEFDSTVSELRPGAHSWNGGQPVQLPLFDYGLERPSALVIDTSDEYGLTPGPTPVEESSTFWEEARAFARDLIFAVLIAILVIVFLIQPVRVEGTSMLPHLHDGERIFVNKFVYRFDKIERGDVVVFWWPNDPSKSFIKRVVGLPGETVSVRDGVVYINGEPIDESYIDTRYHVRHENLSSTFIKNHYYFVMGDNRDSSNDSRTWGLVPEKYIYGKAVFRYWPPDSVGTIR